MTVLYRRTGRPDDPRPTVGSSSLIGGDGRNPLSLARDGARKRRNAIAVRPPNPGHAPGSRAMRRVTSGEAVAEGDEAGILGERVEP